MKYGVLGISAYDLTCMKYLTNVVSIAAVFLSCGYIGEWKKGSWQEQTKRLLAAPRCNLSKSVAMLHAGSSQHVWTLLQREVESETITYTDLSSSCSPTLRWR